MVKTHISSGGVIYRISTPSQIEILLLHKKETNTWHLPKGTQENRESLSQTALREVNEETGFQAKIEKYLGKLPSLKENGNPKLTHYYLMKPITKTRDHENKYDKLEWVEIEKAKKMLAKFTEFENEKGIIEIAEKIIKQKLL